MTDIARGLEGIAVTETRLSRVDGEAGRLVVAGFPVEALAPRASFEEMLFLLWNDRLPKPAERTRLQARLAARRELAPATLAVLRAAAQAGTAPMDALRMGVATLGLSDAALHRAELQAQPPVESQRCALRLVAALPVIAAAYYRLCQGREPVRPDPALGHAASYLHMLFGEVPCKAATRALETYLNTTADHGMNASTFAARVVASTRSCLSSAILAALGALKGPLHGGAPGPALDMVFALERESLRSGRSLESVTEAWVRDRVARGERIMGFGHRVYRARDPRADVLGAAAEQWFREASARSAGSAADGDDAASLYRRARVVEQAVLRMLAELKPGRVLQTNVEFYTALLLHGLRIPSQLFTPTFAVARMAGWTGHVLEQVEEDRLIRPTVAYVGAEGRRWPDAA